MCRFLAVFLWLTIVSAVAEPLPSWNDTGPKDAILNFVKKTTTEGSPEFIPVENRIAVFDNDGTLWPENPVPFQLAFAIDSLKLQIEKDPKLEDDEFVKAALASNAAILLADHNKGLFHIVSLTHAGMTTDEFDRRVNDWLKGAKQPRFDKPYDQCVSSYVNPSVGFYFAIWEKLPDRIPLRYNILFFSGRKSFVDNGLAIPSLFRWHPNERNRTRN